MKKLIIIAVIVIVPLAPILLVVTGVIGKKPVSVSSVSLTYWTVENTPENLKPLIAAYQKQHPYVQINVIQRAADTYRQDLITAWAKGQGPDLFSLPQEDITGFRDFITPLPKNTTVYNYSAKKVLFRTETSISKQTEASLTAARIGADFVDTVAHDVIAADGAILGLPLSLDSLALYYNKDLLSSANIPEPPKTWEEFSAAVPKLTQVDSQDNIIQSGAGFGLGKNVRYAGELIALLILQNGSAIIDPTGRNVPFGESVSGEFSAARPVQYTTDFASAGKEVYTWNDKQTDSLENFLQGKTVFYFGTNSDRQTLDQQQVRLNYSVAPMLHLGVNADIDFVTGRAKQINLAKYWVESVSARSRHPNEAWNFVQFATKKGVVDAYLNSANRPTALRGLVAQQTADLDLGVFANQSLTAISWYRGNDAAAARGALTVMLDDVAITHADIATAIDSAAKKIKVTLPRNP